MDRNNLIKSFGTKVMSHPLSTRQETSLPANFNFTYTLDIPTFFNHDEPSDRLRMYLTNSEDHVDFFVDNLGSNVQEVRMSKGCCLTFGGGRCHDGLEIPVLLQSAVSEV